MQFEYVQNKLLKYATNALSETLQSKVSIDHLEVDLFSNILLDHVYVEDHIGDTLLYIKKVRVKLPYYIYDFRTVEVSKISAEGGVFNVQKYAEDSLFNLQVLLKRLSSDTTNKAGPNPEIVLNNIQLNHFVCVYHNHQDSSNYGYLRLDDLSVIGAFEMEENGELSIRVDQTSFDNSYLVMRDLTGLLSIGDNRFVGQNIYLKTKDSYINLPYLNIAPNAQRKFPDINIQLDKSDISVSDFGQFRKYTSSQTAKVTVFGDLKIENDQLEIKKLGLNSGLATKLSIQGKVGLDTSIEEMQADLEVARLSTNRNELQHLLEVIYPFVLEERKDSDLPKQLRNLNTISFQGIFNKDAQHYKMRGDLNSDLGNVKLKASGNFSDTGKINANGHLKTSNFLVGDLLENELLDDVSANLDFKLVMDSADFRTELKGTIPNLDFKDYNYQNIKIDALLSNNIFNGALSLKDPNLDFDFKGNVKFREELENMNFRANIKKANLSKLNLVNDTLNTMLSTSLEVTIDGDLNDLWEGKLLLKNIKLSNKKERSIELNALYASNDYITKDSTDLKISSSVFDAQFQGKITPKNISNIYKSVVSRYWSHEQYEPSEPLYPFNGFIHFKNTDEISAFFVPDVQLANNSYLRFGFSPGHEQTMELSFKSSKLSVGEMAFDEISFEGGERDSIAFFKGNVDNIKLNNNLSYHNSIISLSKSSLSDTTNFELNTYVDTANGGLVNLEGAFLYKTDTIMATLFPSSQIAYQNIYLNTEAKLRYYLSSKNIILDHFEASNNDSKIYAKGFMDQGVSLNLQVENLSLDFANLITHSYDVDLRGTVNGEAHISRHNNEEVNFISDLNFDHLSVNDNEIGTGVIRSQWLDEKKALDININFENPTYESEVRCVGFIYPQRNNAVDLSINTSAVNLNVLEVFTKDIASQIEGTARAKLTVNGPLDKLKFRGGVQITKCSFVVDYLQTKYELQKTYIKINPDYIGFDQAQLLDQNGNIANVNATMYHKNFSNINFDFGLSSETNFQCMNTTLKDNDLFYGKAFLNKPLINISGYENVILIQVEGTTGKGTTLNLPLSSPKEVSQKDFIVFINPEEELTKQDQVSLEDSANVSSFKGIEMELDIKVKENAQFQIIFDEQVGDVIKTVGNGDIDLKVDSKGNINLFGEYIIEEGDYLFTFQNVLNKKFQIKKGSSISWSGNPYKANLDMVASYRLRAPLMGMVTSLDSSSARKRYPVECQLLISDELMSPNIKFDIDLPSLSESDQLKTELKSNLSTEEQVQNQFFSLLVLGRFTATQNTANGSGGTGLGQSNLSESISNQLSNWLSKLSDDVDVGVNYRPGGEDLSDEVEVALSTKLLNDRLTIEGNLGVTNRLDASSANQATSGIAGDVFVEYDLTKKGTGNTAVQVYNKSNDYDLFQSNNAQYTQGVGLVFKKQFNSLKDLFPWLFSSEDEETKKEEKK